MQSPKENLLLLTSRDEIRHLLDDAVEATLSRALKDYSPPGREPPKEVFSNREAMDYLDLSKSTLQRYRDSGILPYSKIGGNIFYRREDLLSVIEEHRVNNATGGSSPSDAVSN